MGIPLATPASRPGRRAAATLVALLLIAGCEAAAGGPEQRSEGLLTLSTVAGARFEVTATGPDGAVAIGLPLPDDGATWISAGPDGVLVASTEDGQLVTSDPVDPRGSAVDVAGLDWRPVKATTDSADSLPAPASFPTWDPEGKRVAALLGRRDAEGGAVTLLIVDPGDGKATTLALKQVVTGPPAWLDSTRIALPTGTIAEPRSILVDTASGKVTKGPPGERRLATSADGAVIATSAGPGAPVVLRSTKGWLADDGTSIGSVEVPEGFVEATNLALDATGRRLAIIWLDESGTTRCDVHDGDDGWRRVLSHSGNVPAWLR
jgi:hypothetical protein